MATVANIVVNYCVDADGNPSGEDYLTLLRALSNGWRVAEIRPAALPHLDSPRVIVTAVLTRPTEVAVPRVTLRRLQADTDAWVGVGDGPPNGQWFVVKHKIDWDEYELRFGAEYPGLLYVALEK